MPEFDRVAPHYDETRLPPSEGELRAVIEGLGGARDVLDAGVGTGRFARPLLEAGFQVCGVDLSRGMLARARAKGLPRLVRGTLLRLPFRDRAFDAALVVHVLQLVPDPFPVLRELSRVSRGLVLAYLPGPHGGGRLGPVRRRYREIAGELGTPIAPRARYWENGDRIARHCPPTQLTTLELPSSARRRPGEEWQWRTFGGLIDVPEEVHEQIVERLRAEGLLEEPRERPRPREVRLAVWEGEALEARLRESPV